jgi:hypothetical protein
VTGNGSVRFNSVAPMFTAGWGNWISRREHKHLTFPFEVGFAYTGEGTVNLNLKGTVCENPNNTNCSEIATDPTVQANISGQIQKLNRDLSWIRFYPIVSGGVSASRLRWTARGRRTFPAPLCRDARSQLN